MLWTLCIFTVFFHSNDASTAFSRFQPQLRQFSSTAFTFSLQWTFEQITPLARQLAALISYSHRDNFNSFHQTDVAARSRPLNRVHLLQISVTFHFLFLPFLIDSTTPLHYTPAEVWTIFIFFYHFYIRWLNSLSSVFSWQFNCFHLCLPSAPLTRLPPFTRDLLPPLSAPEPRMLLDLTPTLHLTFRIHHTVAGTDAKLNPGQTLLCLLCLKFALVWLFSPSSTERQIGGRQKHNQKNGEKKQGFSVSSCSSNKSCSAGLYSQPVPTPTEAAMTHLQAHPKVHHFS